MNNPVILEQLSERIAHLEVMLETLCNAGNLLQWVDSYSIGKNEGGVYVSLFNERLEHRVSFVYHERAWLLPDYIRNALPKDGDAPEITTFRSKEEKAGRLVKCRKFLIARYQSGEGDKVPWRFGGVVRVAREAAASAHDPAPAQEVRPESERAFDREPPEEDDGLEWEDIPGVHSQSPVPLPAQRSSDPASYRNESGIPCLNVKAQPEFGGKADAIRWAVDCAAYVDYAGARVAYQQVIKDSKASSQGEAFTAWIGHVRRVVAAKARQETERRQREGAMHGTGRGVR